MNRKQSLDEMAEKLANRCKEYVGGTKPDPSLDADLELWKLSEDVLREIARLRRLPRRGGRP